MAYMNSLGPSRYALTMGVVAALLAGCGGSQPPVGASGALPLLRDLPAGGDQVQYVSADPGIAEFDYPKSDSQIHYRHLGHKSYAECSKGSHTFWVVEENSHQVVEFAASRKKIAQPIKTLAVPVGSSPYAAPWDCAVDPTTGNLAVSVADTSSVVIFANGSGSGQTISDTMGGTGWSAYDAQGNLFVQGFKNHKPALVELPKGQTEFQEISLPSTITTLSTLGCCTIRWDGTYLAWLNTDGFIVYRLNINGNQAYIEDTVTLSKGSLCAWFGIWAEAGLFFCGTEGKYVNVYDYPAGGSPIAMLGPLKVGEDVGVVSLQP